MTNQPLASRDHEQRFSQIVTRSSRRDTADSQGVPDHVHQQGIVPTPGIPHATVVLPGPQRAIFIPEVIEMPETSSPVQPITRRGFGVLVGAASSGVAMAAGAASAGAATRVRSHGPSVSSEPFGSIDEGPVRIYTLTNGHGVRVRILNYGGIIQSVEIPDRRGRFANVALGFDNIEDYVAKSPYFGCITGRYANRIAKGTFTLDGVTYHLPINNDPNSLHGGTRGFDKHNWRVEPFKHGSSVGLVLRFTSRTVTWVTRAGCRRR
jgi:hypothetical protein